MLEEIETQPNDSQPHQRNSRSKRGYGS